MANGIKTATHVDSIKDVVRSSVKVTEFDKYQKKAGGNIGRKVVEIMIKMETIVRKPLMMKIYYSNNYLSDIITVGQSGLGNKGKEEVTPHPPDILNWNHCVSCSDFGKGVCLCKYING